MGPKPTPTQACPPKQTFPTDCWPALRFGKTHQSIKGAATLTVVMQLRQRIMRQTKNWRENLTVGLVIIPFMHLFKKNCRHAE